MCYAKIQNLFIEMHTAQSIRYPGSSQHESDDGEKAQDNCLQKQNHFSDSGRVESIVWVHLVLSSSTNMCFDHMKELAVGFDP